MTTTLLPWFRHFEFNLDLFLDDNIRQMSYWLDLTLELKCCTLNNKNIKHVLQ